MNKTDKYTLQSRFALLLLAVFFGSLLLKPAHILLSQHQHVKESISIQNEENVTTNHFVYCPVLDFEFCIFIPQQKTSVPQATMIARNEQTLNTVACLANNSTYLFLLRAPPAL